MAAPGAPSRRYRCRVTRRELARPQWQALEAAHAARVDDATAAHRERRADGRTHPVEDFLFRYYNNSPARLRRWHPGAGVALRDAADLPRATWTHYRVVGDSVEVDVAGFLAARGSAVTFVRELLSATVSRPAQLGCFGLHEWAMVHGIPADDVRHAGWPLRLGSAGTDAVVERHGIRCSHFDAYRFFTDSARPGTRCAPPGTARWRWSSRAACTPAWTSSRSRAFKLTPLVPSDLVGDAFELARETPGARHGGLAVRPARARPRPGRDRDPGWARRRTSSGSAASRSGHNALRQPPAHRARRGARPRQG